MQISKQLKKGQNKKDIEKFEKQLEDLKSSTDDGNIIKGEKSVLYWYQTLYYINHLNIK
jgi:hypothetical protein